MKKYPDIYPQRKTNDTLYSSKPNWKFQRRWFVSRSEYDEILSEYFSNPKNALFLAFVCASFVSLFALAVIFLDPQDEDMGHSIVSKLAYATIIWLVIFAFVLTWVIFGNLILWFRGKKSLFHSEWVSDSFLKYGLFVAFIIASLFALTFIFVIMIPEVEEDMNYTFIEQLAYATFVWLIFFLIEASCLVWGYLFIKKGKSLFRTKMVSEFPLISVKQGTATITCLKYGFYSTFIKVPFQVPVRFKMFTDGDSNITNLDKESIYLDITNVYEHLKKMPMQCFASDNNTNRVYINCNVDKSLLIVWKQFISLCYADSSKVSLSDDRMQNKNEEQDGITGAS
jgi:hypothetical protein